MEMKVGTVSAGTAPVQQSTQAPSSDSGFSEILSGVRSASLNAQAASPKQAGTAVKTADTKQAGTADRAQGIQQTAAPDSPADVQQADTFMQTDVVKETAPVQQDGQVMSVQDAQGVQEGQEVTAQVEFGEIKVKLEGKLAELVWKVSEGKEEAKDEIVQALLDYLKKLQEKGGDDKAISLVMQLLAALRTVQQAPSIDLHVTVQNISAEVTAVSAEYSSTMTGQQEVSQEMFEEASVPFENSDEQGFAPEEYPQDEQKPLESKAQPETVIPQEAAVIPEAAEVQQNAEVQPAGQDVTVRQAPVQTVQAAQTAQNVQNVPEIQTQAVQTEQPADVQPQQTEKFPQSMAESMLNDILEEARKDLGLVKAEFTVGKQAKAELTQDDGQTVQTNAPQDEAQPVKTADAATLEIRPNHRDGREELHSILGGRESEETDEPKKTETPQQNPENAGLSENTPARETAPAAKDDLPKAAAVPPERQLADEMLARTETLEGGRTEFTMVLNPESLGRITVRMASTGGRIEVSIAAENDSTRQLLESRTEQLGTALRQNGVELERYQVVSGQENAQLMQDNYDGSSKNPYGRQDDGENEENEENGNDFLEILRQI